VVDPSSDKENHFLDTSRDEEFTRRLFGDLIRGLIGPPDDGNVIIINNSDEEEHAHEEESTDTDAVPPSTVKSPTPTASVANANDAFEGVPDDSNDGHTSNRT
jgi:hypothetical protein